MDDQLAIVQEVATVDGRIEQTRDALERIEAEAEAFERAVEAERLTPEIENQPTLVGT